MLPTPEEAFLTKYTNKPVSTTSYAVINLVTSSTLAVYGIVHVDQVMWKVFVIALAYAWIFRAIAEIVDVCLALRALHQLNQSLFQESGNILAQATNFPQREAKKR